MHDTWRFERKFIVPRIAPELEQVLRTHPAMFRSLYPARFVSNVYFDTLSFQFVSDTVDGVANRSKVRVRWYGDHNTYMIHAALEVKYKYGFLTRKVVYPLPPFELPMLFSRDFFAHIKASEVPTSLAYTLQTLKPVLSNHYFRRYFISADRKFRITIDDQLSNSIILRDTPARSTSSLGTFVILELKYAPAYDEEVSSITQYFTARLSKFSKYAYGFEQCRV
ncbi:MAG: hypothetical protein A3B74_03180 [Candidatus Kerfeldbacteria bacterium RIFCSPHIGHO2_02_FULL_42_14]|uniref:VTC domain-containing protein n=1 Tax=Candidatus Kerfeldbacteria bacterium RIFCSPHIGHO2_02_FULL_42_14 TaxID=1798540 RepID=A0A1G2AQJ0_9BACT|nr:MAG: hypothetical protein A3B74_03180 [Candidatus Kerfeldbacteria bacterium RIFCSPHIGHO2_02_FULL_42_14]OGY80911.1 MAG: hypothetical protein A3E60_03095 [Candidatus Kerfeldbacteria bacterium RIFCSPHIGHO2_12_FULL_42_13]OGY84144.1 MAG: hypothetical protein A3I91_01495 [Candidatus Kerfeldbacteria bacterium RIFCSPLOWO2_02_FULL_42_19]OGY87274.1 MAG: hypothetical protein A3G01_02965 [Candidatus Kerfeldbacteria bacterium RIFCSPLOWO2_12_FULL_43_9]